MYKIGRPRQQFMSFFYLKHIFFFTCMQIFIRKMSLHLFMQVQCENCARWYHNLCLQFQTDFLSDDKELSWFCQLCRTEVKG